MAGQDDWTSEFTWNGDALNHVKTLRNSTEVFSEVREYDHRNNLTRWSYGAPGIEFASGDIQRDQKDRIRAVHFDYGSANAGVQHGGGNQPFFEAYEYDYRNALSAVHFGTWDPNSGLPSIGLPSTVTNGSLASLGGVVEQRTRGAEVADLMRIEGDDIYGAYGAQQRH